MQRLSLRSCTRLQREISGLTVLCVSAMICVKYFGMLKILAPSKNPDPLELNARAILKRVSSSVYKGWDDIFDTRFDTRSIWIISANENSRIHGFCKVVFANNDQRLPVEYNEQRISIDKKGKKCAEVTSYIFRNQNQAYVLARAALLEIERFGCEMCFCSVDTTNINAIRLITQTCNFMQYCTRSITFAGMRYAKCESIPNWSFLVQNKISRIKAISDLTTSLYPK